MEELLSENKHLKTSIHWLSDELHKIKHKGESENVKKIHLSGCLEEGFNNQTLKLNFPKVTKTMNFPLYIKMLHDTINALKEQLKLSTKQIKRLTDYRVSESSSSNVFRLNDSIDQNEKKTKSFESVEINHVFRNGNGHILEAAFKAEDSKIPMTLSLMRKMA